MLVAHFWNSLLLVTGDYKTFSEKELVVKFGDTFGPVFDRK